jgi:hypothetical protein
MDIHHAFVGQLHPPLQGLGRCCAVRSLSEQLQRGYAGPRQSNAVSRSSVFGVSRRIRGTVVLPADAPTTVAWAIVELRDVSYADARAPVVASITLPDAIVRPHGRIPFELIAPESDAGQQLSLECHIDITGGPTVTAGDLLSTQSVPVPAEGDVSSLDVPVSLV